MIESADSSRYSACVYVCARVCARAHTVFDTTPRLWLHPDGGAGECQRVVENIITRAVTSDAMKVSPEVCVYVYMYMYSAGCHLLRLA